MSSQHHHSHNHALAASEVGALGFAIMTFSDTRTAETDTSGKVIREILEPMGHVVKFQEIVKEDPAIIRERLGYVDALQDVDVIVTNGGTGISLRDSAFEMVSEILVKKIDGFGELFRMLSYEEVGSAAMLSRAVAGVTKNGKLLFSLPGSSKAVHLGMEKLIIVQVGHMHSELHKHKEKS